MTYWNLIESLLAVYIAHPEWAKLHAHVHGISDYHNNITTEIIGKDIYITGKVEKHGSEEAD